jgi:hypothetical protein
MDLRSGAWAAGNGYALLAGEKGLACKANLTSFEVLQSGVATDLADVAYRPGSYATLVGSGGAVLRYDGQSFTPEGTAALQNFNAAAWKADGSAALLVGLDTSNNPQAASWLLDGGLSKVQNNITDRMLDVVWEPGTTMALVVGLNGLVVEYSAGSFDRLSASFSQNLLAVDFRPQGDYALVAGAGGYLARCDGASITPVPTNQVAELAAAAWHPSGDFALVCGQGGIVIRYTHWNSTADVLATGLEGRINYTGISWKPDGTSALLCGEAGKMVKYDGVSFVLQQSPSPLFQVNYWDVAWKPDGAYALIAAVSGNILRYEERALPAPLDFCVTRAAGAPGVNFFAVAWLPDPARTEALVSGMNGALYSWDENGAAACATDTRRSLYAVDWMPGSEYALAAGDAGALLECVGYGFIHPSGGTDTVFRDIAWKPDGSYALVAGHSGALLKFSLARRSTPKAVISSPRQNAVFEPGASILFDGSNSTPTFNQSLTFQWLSSIGGPLGNGARLTKTLGAGLHRVTLFANDTSGHSSSATVDFVVKAPNRSPVMVIDSPQDGATYNNTDDVLFDASRSSDPDGDPLSFYWTSSRGGHLGSAPSFSARLVLGSHVITLWLNDSMGYNITRSVTINIIPLNHPPVPLVRSPVSSGEYNDRAPVLFDGTLSSDEDGDPLDYYWTSNVTGFLGGTSRFSRTLPAGAHLITLWVDDLRGANRSAAVNITVLKANSPPTVTLDVPAEGAVLKGVAELSGVALDPEGGNLTVLVQIDAYPWTIASGGASWNYSFDTTRFANGRHTIRVKASDGLNESAETVRTVTVANPGWGWTVTIAFPLDGTRVGGKVKLEGTASRMGSLVSQVEYRIDNGEWAVASSTTQWTAVWDSARVKNGAHRVTVRAYDGTDYSPETGISLLVDNRPAVAEPAPFLLILALIIVAAVVASAAVLLLRRRTAGGGEAPGPAAKDGDE